MRIKIHPVRWWRDDVDRFVARGERRHFNLSEVPRGDNPELDAFVEHWQDTIGFAGFDALPPLEFEHLEPMTTEWRVDLRMFPPPIPYFGLF
jgi:hypothetical protein